MQADTLPVSTCGIKTLRVDAFINTQTKLVYNF